MGLNQWRTNRSLREFLNPNVSRSGLDRFLRRHGVSNLRELQARAARPKRSGFKACEPGYIHTDVKYLPQMADETAHRYLFVTIDRATRWVFIRTILTDNSKEFTDRLFDLRKRAAAGAHAFDKLCAEQVSTAE